MALGIYITFRILNVSDLTADGSFATGAAVAAVLITSGVNPIFAILCAFITGCLCGMVTALLHTKLKIPAVLSSILVQLALYSIDYKITSGKSMISLNPDVVNVILTSREKIKPIIVVLLFAIVIILLLYWFFGTEIGSAIRASGNNIKMAKANGINTNTMSIIGLALSNGIIALAGSLAAQYNAAYEINMGKGAIVIGLAAIIVGEVISSLLFKKSVSFFLRFSFVQLGGILYYLIMIIILWLRVDSSDLKLFTALLVAIILAIGKRKEKGEN